MPHSRDVAGVVTALPPPLRFSEGESDAANAEWGANCGPHSIAAIMQLPLHAVRAVLGEFKGWMSPTMVGAALRALGAPYGLHKGLKTKALCEGVNRVQWEGRWLDPGVPPLVAYHHTHWVAQVDGWVLCTVVSPARWVRKSDWEEALLRASRPWHVTHHYRLEGRSKS